MRHEKHGRVLLKRAANDGGRRSALFLRLLRLLRGRTRGKRPGFLMYFGGKETSETYGEQFELCPGCALRDWHSTTSCSEEPTATRPPEAISEKALGQKHLESTPSG